jgi:hypothetical protein
MRVRNKLFSGNRNLRPKSLALPIKLKHFMHPARSIRTVRDRVVQRNELRQLIQRGQSRFSADPRYRISLVEHGLRPRVPHHTTANDNSANDNPANDNSPNDNILLRRICDAYCKAMERQASLDRALTANHFSANDWWRLVQRASLGPVMRALAAHDLESLGAMYRNFFRDPCGAGLTGLPGIVARLYGSPHMSTVGEKYKHLLLIDALHRQDLWNEKTAGRYSLASLETPATGNPFGVVLENAFIRTGAEDQHFYAHRTIDLLRGLERPVVAEIGGGYGGMAYYLIRDLPGVSYLDFDVPETIALASWYLLKAFPKLDATLYGEAELNAETLRRSQIILMPAFVLDQLPEESVDLSFNAHVLSDMAPSQLHEYLAAMTRTTRRHILHLNRAAASRAVSDYIARGAQHFLLVSEEQATWNSARSLQNDEREYLYTRPSVSAQPVT